jgi:hypothetical protein
VAAAGQAVNADAAALEDFTQRVTAYVDLHRVAEGTLSLREAATPEEIVARQRRLADGIRATRTQARQGDLFTPAMQTLVRRIIADLAASPEGREIVASVMDENPRGIVITINSPYPDTVPLSTMPPQLLMALPTMPEELEYRFVGDNLVVLDQHAHLIVDFVPYALPDEVPP